MGSSELTSDDPDPAVPSPPGKSLIRPALPSTTEGKTLELLRVTIIPNASYSEQTLSERTESINRLLQEAAIPPDRLRIVLADSLARNTGSSEWRLEALELRNVSVAEILKYTAGSTKIRYRVRPGIVEWVVATEEDPDASTDRESARHPERDDPFGIPPVE